MIDIHCHILPDFDDGAADLEQSLAMAHIAALSGTGGIIATPHFRGEERSVALVPKLMARFERLERALAATDIPVTLYPGAEILCLPETPRMAKLNQLPTLSGTNYLLVEFYFDENPEYMNEMLKVLKSYGYRLVVAHPERYDAIQNDPLMSRRWFEAGYYLQLNKGSLLGAFGQHVQYTAMSLLEEEQVHLIASDGHGITHRSTDMRSIRQWLSRKCRKSYAELLLEENPLRLIQGEDLLCAAEAYDRIVP